LLHAVSRLALNPFFKNIQTSWPKMGRDGAAACLSAGCNDFGGTLMNESISRAAGGRNGNELPPQEMETLIRDSERVPLQRTTLYLPAATERVAASLRAAALSPLVNSGLAKGRGPHTNIVKREDLSCVVANDLSAGESQSS
jgi:FO synthase